MKLIPGVVPFSVRSVGPDQPEDLAILRKPSQRLFREDLLAVDGDLEDAAASGDQLALDA
jgi:hypothetical protein